MLFHGFAGETTTKPSVTTPNIILPKPPSHVDSDISVYVGGTDKVRYHFLFLLYLTILHQLQEIHSAECKDYHWSQRRHESTLTADIRRQLHVQGCAVHLRCPRVV